MNNNLMEDNKIIIYKTDDGQVEIEVKLEEENVWITQNAMAELFDTTKQNISLHIKNIFDENELDENSVVKENLTTAKDGKKYKTKFYNLDLIIAVGYRVKSVRATQFRIGLTNFRGNVPTKAETEVAKNYLDNKELKKLK